MSRKDDPKAKDALVTVNIEDFTRTRDSVIVSLTQLQSAVSDLTRAYINHANTVLNRSPTGLDMAVGGIASGITANLLETGLLSAPRAVSPGARSETGGEKKKRKRAPPDPNAPKRALTPFFLYMQNNRSRIAEELGDNARPKEVADEGTRRWAEMPDAQKEVWKKLYADNLAIYKEKMKAYKAGLPIPEDDSAKAAKQLHQGVAGADVSDDEDEDESEAEPVKAPSPPRSNKRRRSDVPKTPKETATKDTATAASAASKQASPEKKKKRATKKDKEEAAAAAAAATTAAATTAPAAPAATPVATKKTPASEAKRGPKKKRKSEAAATEA